LLQGSGIREEAPQGAFFFLSAAHPEIRCHGPRLRATQLIVKLHIIPSFVIARLVRAMTRFILKRFTFVTWVARIRGP
jgi:hypothetical protein